MKPNALLAAAASFVLGTVALRMYLARVEERIGGGPRSAVLMLTTDLAAGESIPRAALALRELPAAYRDSRHIAATELEGLVGARLAVPARASEALLWTDLAAARSRRRQLSGLVPSGKRAMTLEGGARELQALIAPGDRVDVLGSPEGTAGGAPRVQTVASDLLVLAIGSDLGGGGATPSARAGAITVSVTPEQSYTLAAAERRGALRVVLRNPDDLAWTRGEAPLGAQETTP